MAIQQLIEQYEKRVDPGVIAGEANYIDLLAETQAIFDEMVEPRVVVFELGWSEVFRAIDLGDRVIAGTQQQLVAQPTYRILRYKTGRAKRGLELRVPHEGIDITTMTERLRAQNSEWIGSLAVDSSNRTPTKRSIARLSQFRELLDEVRVHA